MSFAIGGNSNLSAPCRMRGEAALMTLPKVELPMSPSAARAVELGMIEDVEGFHAEDQAFDSVSEVLGNGHVVLSAPGP